MQVVSSHPAGVAHGKAGAGKELEKLVQTDGTMAATKVTEYSRHFARGSGELDNEQTATRLGDSTHLERYPPPSIAADVMQHQRGEHHIEARIRERQRLGDGTLKGNIYSRPARCGASAANHLRRGVNAANRARRSDAPLGHNRQRSGPASNIQHCLTGQNARELQKTLAERTSPTSQRQPHAEIVESGRVVDFHPGLSHW